MTTTIEPIGFGSGTFGPFADEIDASEFMDEHGLTDADHKIVVR